MSACPFCQPPEIPIAENAVALAIDDKYPVSPGHCLIISRRHVSTIFALPGEEYLGCFQLVRTVKELLERRYSPAGFNLVVNSGTAAGQTVDHAHIHVVPRFEGDLLQLKML